MDLLTDFLQEVLLDLQVALQALQGALDLSSFQVGHEALVDHQALEDRQAEDLQVDPDP